jgi:hypothetical protein
VAAKRVCTLTIVRVVMAESFFFCSFSDYMNGFKCNVTGSTSTVPVAQSKLARRCGADPKNGKPHSAPGNCTYGAKQPYYWFNLERNNVSSQIQTFHFSFSFVKFDRCEK